MLWNILYYGSAAACAVVVGNAFLYMAEKLSNKFSKEGKMDSIKGLLKLIVALIILAAIIALPAFAGETTSIKASAHTDAEVYEAFAQNTVRGWRIGLAFRGKKTTPEMERRAYMLAKEAIQDIVRDVKAAGVYDEYRAQLFDKDIRDIDNRLEQVKTIEEVRDMILAQLKIIKQRYPRLYTWMQRPEATERSRKLLVELAMLAD